MSEWDKVKKTATKVATAAVNPALGAYTALGGDKAGSNIAQGAKKIDGTESANKKEAKSVQSQKDALATFQGLTPPSIGNVTLAKSTYAPVGNTAYSGIKADANDAAATQAAMGGYDDIINNGGLTATDKANIQQGITNNNTVARGQREAILQDAQARGMGGGGNELLAQLSNSQSEQNQNNQNGLTIQGQAQQNALGAIQNKGVLSAADQAAKYTQANTVAGATDALKQFNASNTLANNQFNTGIQNNQTMQNSIYTPQQNYANQVTKASGVAGQQVSTSGMYQNLANQQNIQNGQILGGVAQVGAAAAGAPTKTSDRTEKTDISPMKDGEIDEFLDSVKGKKYKYTDPTKPTTAPGTQQGFMLQDVANTKLGKDLVQHTEDGKMAYNKDNLDGIMLAALAKMHKEKK